jgi:hypothetical protein
LNFQINPYQLPLSLFNSLVLLNVYQKSRLDLMWIPTLTT